MASSTRETSTPPVGATRARQGRSGRHVFWVLLFGTLLAALALMAAWAWRSDDLGESEANNGPSERAELFNAPEPAPINSAVEGNNAPDNLAPAGGQQPNPSSPPAP